MLHELQNASSMNSTLGKICCFSLILKRLCFALNSAVSILRTKKITAKSVVCWALWLKPGADIHNILTNLQHYNHLCHTVC